MITAELVKELREKTGAGMMDCKKALTEVGGNIEKAVDFLREKGLASAAKKTGRVAAEGAVDTHISEDGKTAVISEVNCETDFVAKNEGFKNFIKEVGSFIATSKVADLASELNDKAKAVIANIGENVVVRRYEKYEMDEPGVFGSYIHMGGKIGVLVQIACDDLKGRAEEVNAVAKDIAMHIAASNPTYLDKDDVPADVMAHEKEVLKKQAMEEGKPENIAEKMVEGRLGKMYKDVCLMEQPFVKDPDKSIRQYVEEKAKELGLDLKVKKFTRFMTGEGIEKKQENLADEIEKQINDAK